MAQTPNSNSRLSLMNPSLHHGLRLTPSQHATNSPYTPGRSSPLRSPIKPPRTELGIALKQVIGATASTRNAIDGAGRSLAFTAGAAAVIATHDAETGQVEQRFYRARPTAVPLNPVPIIYDHGAQTQPLDARLRTTSSPFGTPTREQDLSSGKFGSAKERVKAAVCVSLSPSGQFLAVGEAGYCPRVIIFPTASDASADIPLTCMTDHTFGVRCVAFSPDSQYLASLGAANDGFLYIWRIAERTGAATLFASNKCTNNITQMAWVGNKLVTIGTRHIKIWRTEESTPSTPARSSEALQSLASPDNRTLLGRNCVLGELLDATFTVIVPQGSSQAVVCSDKGDICILRETDGHYQLYKCAQVQMTVTAAVFVSGNRLLVAGSENRLQLLDSAKLQDTVLPAQVDQEGSTAHTVEGPQILAFTQLNGSMGILDADGGVSFADLLCDGAASSLSSIFKLPAQGGPVLGVRALDNAQSHKSTFFTWTGDGTVSLWDPSGNCVKRLNFRIEQPGAAEDGMPNELRVARIIETTGTILIGDKYGVLGIYELSDGAQLCSVRAHGAEVTDIAVHDGSPRFFATSGRDRTIQVFAERSGTWELLQTLDEHVGAVTGIMFSKDGESLLSCSADRTVVVRERASKEHSEAGNHAFIINRTITLKGTPLSMAFDPFQETMLFVSTIDRFIHRFDLRTGKSASSFKTADSDGGDAVVMSALVAIPTLMSGTFLAGLSSTDKSVRIYDESGTLLGRDWGHTEGITDIAILDQDAYSASGTSQRSLVTVALDGTIFTWRADLRPQRRHEPPSRYNDSLTSGENIVEKDSLMARPPLRRVLSQSELAAFKAKRSPELEETPTRVSNQRSPQRARRRVSRMSLAGTPKLESSPAGTPGKLNTARCASAANRSPSPPSPRLSAATIKRRQSMEPSARSVSKTKSLGSLRDLAAPLAPSMLARDTDAICRNLRVYRKKLTTSSDNLTHDVLREVQKELSLTIRAVGERVVRPRAKEVDEEVLSRLLDQYNSKLVGILDERFANLSLNPPGGNGPDVPATRPDTGRHNSIEDTIQEHAEEEKETS